MEHAAIIGGGVGARQCGLRKCGGDEGAEKVSGALAEAAFREVADHDRALVHQAAESDGAARRASILRRLGTMSALPIFVWIGATASPRKLSEYPAYSFCQNARTTGSLTWRSMTCARNGSSMSRRGSMSRVAPGTSSRARTALVRM